MLSRRALTVPADDDGQAPGTNPGYLVAGACARLRPADTGSRARQNNCYALCQLLVDLDARQYRTAAVCAFSATSCSHSALLSTADPMPVDLASAAPRSQDRSSGPHGSALPDMDFRSRPALTFRPISSPNPAARTGARHGGLDLSARAAVLAGTSWAAITRHGIVSPRRSSPVRGVASTTTPNQRPASGPAGWRRGFERWPFHAGPPDH